jgi:hypothetical protein
MTSPVVRDDAIAMLPARTASPHPIRRRLAPTV